MRNDVIKKTNFATLADMQQFFREYIDLNNQVKQLEKIRDAKKAAIEEFMRAAKIQKIKAGDNFLCLSKDFSYSSIDTKALKQKEPESYEQLLAKYSKEISCKGYLKVI